MRLIVGAVGISAPGFMSLQVPAERIEEVDELVAAIEAAAAEGV